MKLWICGQRLNYDDNKEWEFVGVYETEQLAIDACSTDLFFVGPVELNVSFPDETVEWPGAYYPKAEP